MDRSKSEYLQKILDNVHQQNVDHFENMACEYSILLKHYNGKEKGSANVSGIDDFKLDQSSQKTNKRKSARRENNNASNDEPISFLKNPEALAMHLEILYKSLPFLCKDRIESILEEYKIKKANKIKEEEYQRKL